MSGQRQPGTVIPEAEVRVDAGLVARLLESQHPDLAHRPVWLVGEGWDNFMYRLGDELMVRLPRREVAAGLILNEQRCLPILSARLPIKVPVPIRTGRPGADFPWHWSILPWLHGRTADLETLADDQALVLAGCLAALHRPGADAPANPVRGVPIAGRALDVEARMERLPREWLAPEIKALWRAALGAENSRQRLWLHGDLHPRNLLVQEGRLTGMIDWGDVTAGDPATDLACIWMLFDKPDVRVAARRRYADLQPTAMPLWRRAAGWALLFAIQLMETGLTHDPQQVVMGERTLAALRQDAGLLLA